MAVNFNHVPLEEGDDPYLTLTFGDKGQYVATFTATFEGDWKDLVSMEVPETQARELFAADVFDLIYTEFAGATVEAGSEDTPA